MCLSKAKGMDIIMGKGKKVIIRAPYIDQSGRYPTGCESVSAVMLLRHLGVDITVDEFIRSYLEQKAFEVRNGELFGPDPRKYFCGNPYDEDAFGCYAPVIVNALDKVFLNVKAGEYGIKQEDDLQYRAIDETGTPLEELLTKYIDHGMPVICWACIDMREPVIGPQWYLFDTATNQSPGEVFTWISNEHCMLLVGYDEENYYFNDPHNGNGLTGYPRKITEKRHRAQHMQAVGVINASSSL